jgi:catechol 2,3-dioxygenase-like lactoylglutathione lyase family enzyme
MNRRAFLGSLPALAAAPRALAQQGPPPIPVRKLSHMALIVSDLKRSLEFYQGLFGLPVLARRENTVLFRVGGGPQSFALTQAAGNARPGYGHYGMSVEGFDAGRIVTMLSAHGVARADSGQPRTVRVAMRGVTPEVFLSDPDGIVVQLQDTSYCGGSGPLGNACAAVEAPRTGLFGLRDLNHFTLSVSDAQRSRAFYQQVFGMSPQAYQGPGAPALGVGSSRHFIMAAGGGGARAAAIGHGCFTMEAFNVDPVLKALADYGVKPRGSAAGPAPPLVSYVSLRMENRGGAREGTPELYFTDPDGIPVQLQDPRYCGGGGYLGDVCA